MEFKRRKSDQREKIYGLIKNSTSHPTAIWIYHKLRKEIPTLSLGNVYRNINILIEEGRIKARKFGGRVEHYDAIISVHYHFVCEKCKTISDFELPVQNDITKLAQKKTKHQISGHTIQFFGVCEKCSKKTKK